MVFSTLFKKARQIKEPTPPSLKPDFRELVSVHGDVRIDPYYFLRDIDDSRTLPYLRRENLYAAKVMKKTKALQETLFEEIRARSTESDISVPIKIGGYFYYYRLERDKPYRMYFRQKDTFGAPEELLLNLNKREGKSLRLGVFKVSPDGRYLAYSIDRDGGERFTVYIKDLSTGKTLEEELPDSHYTLEWFNDASGFLYTVLDKANRPYRVYAHTLGNMAHEDRLVFEEKDAKLFVMLSKSLSQAHVFISSRVIRSRNRLSKEVLSVDANDPSCAPKAILGREPGRTYFVEHHPRERAFYVAVHEKDNPPLRIRKIAADTGAGMPAAGYDGSMADIEDFFVFSNHTVTVMRQNGKQKIRVYDLRTKHSRDIAFEEEAYAIEASIDPISDAGELPLNPRFETDTFRFMYSSFLTPQSVFEYDMNTGERRLIKQRIVEGGYRRTRYATERVFAVSEDGTRIPLSLAYRKGLEKDGTNPVYLTGYAAYGWSYEAEFSPAIFSLLDRGFVVAIAHPRGGGELGYRWYDAGRLLNKKRTIADFIACAEHLVDAGYAAKKKIIAAGHSAGGIMVASAANLRPDLFLGVIAEAPFVDVVTTMLDESLPLTVTEYTEWGDPRKREYYEYMLSYSPYDTVGRHEYPHMLITTGINDPRVSFWEPAKLAAKIRAMKTGDSLLLLETDMEAGHTGAAARFDAIRETAHAYAFMLMIAGIKK